MDGRKSSMFRKSADRGAHRRSELFVTVLTHPRVQPAANKVPPAAALPSDRRGLLGIFGPGGRY